IATNHDGSSIDYAATCFIDDNGAVWCSGADRHGHVGQDEGVLDPLPYDSPQMVPGLDGTDPAVDLCLAYWRSCAVFASGQARCWGKSGAGIRGCGPNCLDYGPVLVEGLDGLTPATSATALACGQASTCFITETGSVSCLGSDIRG